VVQIWSQGLTILLQFHTFLVVLLQPLWISGTHTHVRVPPHVSDATWHSYCYQYLSLCTVSRTLFHEPQPSFPCAVGRSSHVYSHIALPHLTTQFNCLLNCRAYYYCRQLDNCTHIKQQHILENFHFSQIKVYLFTAQKKCVKVTSTGGFVAFRGGLIQKYIKLRLNLYCSSEFWTTNKNIYVDTSQTSRWLL